MSYEHNHEHEIDIPLLRWGCAHLALEMHNTGYNNNEIIKNWKNIALNDPLPKVRNAKSTYDRIINK